MAVVVGFVPAFIPHAAEPSAVEWKLVWSDEFDGKEIAHDRLRKLQPDQRLTVPSSRRTGLDISRYICSDGLAGFVFHGTTFHRFRDRQTVDLGQFVVGFRQFLHPDASR